MNDGYSNWITGLAIALVGMSCLFLFAVNDRNAYRAEAIEHGCAAYDPQTGDWEWVE